MTGFFDGISGILDEIAPSALLPHNDAGNSKFFVMTKKRKSGDFYRDCPVKPDNDTELRNSRIPIYLKVI